MIDKNPWMKTPKHILRFAALQYLTKHLIKGSFIEFGAGTGDFTRYFLDRGFWGAVYDIDPRTISILTQNLSKYGNVNILENLDFEDSKSYDYVFAFEVLEHIENDAEALKMWANFLKSEGMLIASVPAHKRKFSLEDKRVGHIRRYEKKQLIALVEKAGFEEIHVINYGYPLGNITRTVKNLFSMLWSKQEAGASNVENSIKSGIERDAIENKIKFLFFPPLFIPFIIIQRLFFNMDLGDGYILVAKNKR